MKSEEEKKNQDQCIPPTCADVFVVVHVFYDRQRFQDNLGATTDTEKAHEIAVRESIERGNRNGSLPVIESAKESFAMDSPEIRHIWIEVFKQDCQAPDSSDELSGMLDADIDAWRLTGVKPAPVEQRQCVMCKEIGHYYYECNNGEFFRSIGEFFGLRI